VEIDVGAKHPPDDSTITAMLDPLRKGREWDNAERFFETCDGILKLDDSGKRDTVAGRDAVPSRVREGTKQAGPLTA
jgi:hypothetical protein